MRPSTAHSKPVHPTQPPLHNPQRTLRKPPFYLFTTYASPAGSPGAWTTSSHKTLDPCSGSLPISTTTTTTPPPHVTHLQEVKVGELPGCALGQLL